MKKMIFLLLLLASQAVQAQKTYIFCGKLIDGISNTIQKQVTIIVDSGKIAGIEKGYIDPGVAGRVIDLKSKTVLPGLIDCHVHLEDILSSNTLMEVFTLSDADIAYRSVNFAKRTLLAGFTTVRDLGGTGVNISMKKAVENGWIDGPRIFTAGKIISSSGGASDPSNGFRDDVFSHRPGPGDGVADGKDELIKAVRLQIKSGADIIKIASTGGVFELGDNNKRAKFTIEEIKTVVEIARDYGLKVACHAHGAEGIRRAVIGGVASIEHGTYMDDEDIKLMKQYGTWYVPTIIAGKAVADSARKGYYPPIIASKGIAFGEQIQKTFAKAYKEGVKIAFGTDAGAFDHGKNYLEFQYMVEAGMPEMEAIKSATSNAAILLGKENDLGSVSKGKFADIIAVDGDPLTDIKVMKNVVFVMKAGKVFVN
ncbi:metal-dependent hydrolase family protein [Mucilaginibacter sp. SP1R1]|uniref:metal-dependent hydrolase family protein n=1 Tax=Mucilaginibacter sp. SP1R1 TaxID=2723091 RepID=UPI0016137E5E|nr:amidohydrolase family protein [Mucilaginibacter sp. SP1R1]MBB6148426.1 imidazolonepropionase-like amidohydrolase [Mucilaginibacter sp. SP1R1]